MLAYDSIDQLAAEVATLSEHAGRDTVLTAPAAADLTATYRASDEHLEHPEATRDPYVYSVEYAPRLVVDSDDGYQASRSFWDGHPTADQLTAAVADAVSRIRRTQALTAAQQASDRVGPADEAAADARRRQREWVIPDITPAAVAEKHAQRARDTERALSEVVEARDDAIRHALSTGIKATVLAERLGIGAPRIYQIRDRRR